MDGKKIAYVRVSTVDQNEGRQVEALTQYGIDKWFKEKVSAKDTKRTQLQAMLDYAREGDTVYVLDFSRLARSTKDLLDIVESMAAKGITLKSIKENLDTATPTGCLMLTMIGAINEFERKNILERQREGIALAKGEGRYKGRKEIQKPKEWAEYYDRWKRREVTAKEVMDTLGIKRNTFYKWIKEQ